MNQGWLLDLIRRAPEIQREKRERWEKNNQEKIKVYKEVYKRYRSEDWEE